MTNVILDASALIAVIYEEKGASFVAEHLPHSIISTVNFSEVVSYMVKRGMNIKEIRKLLDDLPIEIIPYESEHAFITGELILRTNKKGLSLADRSCIALALDQDLPVLTSDRAWDTLDLGITVKLIR